MWLKILLFICSLLVAMLLIAGSFAFREYSNLLTVIALRSVGALFILCSVRGFFYKRNARILIMPVVLFAGYGLFEIAYIGSGMLSNPNSSVSILHWSILVFLRIVMPLCLSWACWQVMRRKLQDAI